MQIDFNFWTKRYQDFYKKNNITIRYRDNNGNPVDEQSPYFKSIFREMALWIYDKKKGIER